MEFCDQVTDILAEVVNPEVKAAVLKIFKHIESEPCPKCLYFKPMVMMAKGNPLFQEFVGNGKTPSR